MATLIGYAIPLTTPMPGINQLADRMAGVKYAEGAAAQNRRIVIPSRGGHPGSFTALPASVIKPLTGYCTRQE